MVLLAFLIGVIAGFGLGTVAVRRPRRSAIAMDDAQRQAQLRALAMDYAAAAKRRVH